MQHNFNWSLTWSHCFTLLKDSWSVTSYTTMMPCAPLRWIYQYIWKLPSHHTLFKMVRWNEGVPSFDIWKVAASGVKERLALPNPIGCLQNLIFEWTFWPGSLKKLFWTEVKKKGGSILKSQKISDFVEKSSLNLYFLYWCWCWKASLSSPVVGRSDCPEPLLPRSVPNLKKISVHIFSLKIISAPVVWWFSHRARLFWFWSRPRLWKCKTLCRYRPQTLGEISGSENSWKNAATSRG